MFLLQVSYILIIEFSTNTKYCNSVSETTIYEKIKLGLKQSQQIIRILNLEKEKFKQINFRYKESNIQPDMEIKTKATIPGSKVQSFLDTS